MSHDDDVYDDDDLDNDEPEQQAPNWRRQLERKATKAEKRASEAESRADAAERRLAFAEAGVPLDDPKSRYFVKGYDGDLTADAIKAAAAEAGLLAAPTEPADDGIPPEEQAAHQRIADTAVGGRTPAGYGFDEKIAEAHAAGNHLAVIALKQQRAASRTR